MKPVTITLFLLGCFWALIAWGFVISPIGILIPSYDFQSHDVISSLIASLLSLIGYFVWFGWGFYSWTTRFPLVTTPVFWGISLILHMLWLFALPFLLEMTYSDLMEDTAMTCYLGWIVINICSAGIFLGWGAVSTGQSKKTQNRVPGSD